MSDEKIRRSTFGGDNSDNCVNDVKRRRPTSGIERKIDLQRWYNGASDRNRPSDQTEK